MIKDTDKGFKALLARIKASKLKITVGVHAEEGSATYEGGATVAQVASYQEFGTDRIPARPFLSGWVDTNKQLIQSTIAKAGEKIVEGTDPRKALDAAAQFFAGQVQKGISAGIPPALKDSTIQRKKSSVPLIDTGQLRSSIRGHVS